MDQGGKINISDVYRAQQCEDRLAAVIDNPEDLVTDKIICEALEAAAAIAGFLSERDGAVLKVLRCVHQRPSLHDLADFLRLQIALTHFGVPATADRQAMCLFSTFRDGDLRKLQAILDDYRAARWPLFGYVFAGRTVRALDARLGVELAPINARNAHRKLGLLENAHAAFAKLSSDLTRAGMTGDLTTLAFQQAIEGLPPLREGAEKLLNQVALIPQAIEQRPGLKDEIGLNPDTIDEWAGGGSSALTKSLRDVISYASDYKALREAFGSIPEFDYAGDKSKLESLHAQRLAHTLDGQVVDFADNHRNLSRGIRDIIRKKQQFPKSDFGTMQRAFPCMIAGIRDYAEYIPLQKGLFDIVIIDEASQVSIAQAFPAFLRAKKLVVLGDRKQFSNVKTATASIEINNKYANAIIDDYRREKTPDVDTLNRLKLFNIKTSVLEFVERIANSHTMLRKHFRGYPELISFSSKTFYKGQLQAVKIRGLPIDDVIRFTQVPDDGRAEVRKNVNSAEWEAILEELRRLAACDEAPGVGIITPFAEQQSFIVQKLGALPDSELIQTRLKLKVMTFDSCQGEERDVIIYSLVATSRANKLAYIFPKSLADADEVDHALRLQRLNVGFSRAKERIHFFHSMPVDAYSGAISQAINHYVNQLAHAHERPTGADTDPNSPMESRVLSWLTQTRFVQMLDDYVEIDPQFELGAYLRQLDPGYRHPDYRVDFLMKVKSSKGIITIVIEYDGFKEHFTNLDVVHAGNYQSYYRPDDVERQKVLEGYGYRFLRINRFNLGRDPVKTLDARLVKLAGDALQDAQTHRIIDEVKETAEGLISGGKKVCKACGEVRDIGEFRDPELNGRIGRKCMHCKRAERTAKAATAPGRRTRRGKRAWRRW